MKIEVAIVGGGPAGICAGIQLQKSGVPTVIIDSQKYPHKKTCAGILTEKTYVLVKELLPFDDISGYTSSKQVSLYYNNKNMYSFFTQKPFVFVSRSHFDYELLKHYKQLGGIVLSPEKLLSIHPSECRLELSSSNSLFYNALIAADGVNSSVRKMLGLPDIRKGFCIQNSISLAECPDFSKNFSGLYLNYGSLPCGYNWVVPNEEEIILGTGVMVSDFIWNSLLQEHENFCSVLRIPKGSKQRGAFIPIGDLTDQQHHPYENIVFAGDSAGYINPITGEGIYLALLSGKYAAKAYVTFPQSFRTAFLSMAEPVRNTIYEQKTLLPEIYEADFLKNFIFQFKDSPEYIASICDDVISSGKRSYNSFFSEVKALLR